jgi:hypothetical protein
MNIINEWGRNSAHLTKNGQEGKLKLDDFENRVIRRTINEFHTTEDKRPTLQSLLPVLKKKINFSGGK